MIPTSVKAGDAANDKEAIEGWYRTSTLLVQKSTVSLRHARNTNQSSHTAVGRSEWPMTVDATAVRVPISVADDIMQSSHLA
jgi:hypothetical protein